MKEIQEKIDAVNEKLKTAMANSDMQGLRNLMGDPAWTEAFPEDWLEFHCTPERVASFRKQFRP